MYRSQHSNIIITMLFPRDERIPFGVRNAIADALKGWTELGATYAAFVANADGDVHDVYIEDIVDPEASHAMRCFDWSYVTSSHKMLDLHPDLFLVLMSLMPDTGCEAILRGTGIADHVMGTSVADLAGWVDNDKFASFLVVAQLLQAWARRNRDSLELTVPWDAGVRNLILDTAIMAEEQAGYWLECFNAKYVVHKATMQDDRATAALVTRTSESDSKCIGAGMKRKCIEMLERFSM